MQASPLLTDSRHWQDRRGSGDSLPLPGSIEDQGFVESVMNTLEQRLMRPQVLSVPSMEKVLTPVMEREDYPLSSEDDDETHITITSANSTLDRQKHRRVQSLTKSNSDNFIEENSSCDHDNVFHTSSNSSITCEVGGMLHSSRSENYLLHHSDIEEGSIMNSFEKDILKFVGDSEKRKSNDSIDSQDPFQSADVQALLENSSYENSNEGRSLPRNFHRPLFPLLPMRQMSEGQIKPLKSPHFNAGSSPLYSPVSLTSIDKSMSMVSSQGSFSDGFIDDTTTSDFKRTYQVENKECREQKSVESNKTEEEGEGKMETDLGKEHVNLPVLQIRKQRGRGKMTDSGIEDQNFNSVIDGEIPLPDDSPTIGASKIHSLKYKYSSSRDSGLSDSPDPFVEFSSSQNPGVSSNILADKLAVVDKEIRKSQISPLVKEKTNKGNIFSQQTLSDNTRRFQEDIEALKNTTPSRPTKLIKHVTKVLKITPSDEMLPSPPVLSPDSGNCDNIPVQRLRMASPEELLSPTFGQFDFTLKRSRSQGETLKTVDDYLEDETIVGDLIISEAKIGRKMSRADTIMKNLSKSMELLR